MNYADVVHTKTQRRVYSAGPFASIEEAMRAAGEIEVGLNHQDYHIEERTELATPAAQSPSGDEGDWLLERRIWKLLAESVEGEADGTTIPVPAEDIRVLLRNRHRGPITDEMLEAAAQAYAGGEMSADEWAWVKTQPEIVEPYLSGMRAALEAARHAEARSR